MGRKLADHLRRSGFTVTQDTIFGDAEFSFLGAALPAVLAAWRARLDRMRLLRVFCGPDFEAVRDEFLGCLTRTDHRSDSTVRFCLAARGIADHSRTA